MVFSCVPFVCPFCFEIVVACTIVTSSCVRVCVVRHCAAKTPHCFLQASGSMYWDWAKRLLKLVLLTVVVVSAFVLQRVLLLICPPLLKKLHQTFSPMRRTTYAVEDYFESFALLSNIPYMWEMAFFDCMFQKARVGDKAPYPTVLTSDGENETHLLEISKPGRPLVLNFGNAS